MTSFLKEMLKEKVCWGEGVFPFWHQKIVNFLDFYLPNLMIFPEPEAPS